ncbi:MAG: hypothetical protein HY063_09790 [Bacteroidetes bacterium]|nr:hypothetical protein [Bacteroidota bacterium]
MKHPFLIETKIISMPMRVATGEMIAASINSIPKQLGFANGGIRDRGQGTGEFPLPLAPCPLSHFRIPDYRWYKDTLVKIAVASILTKVTSIIIMVASIKTKVTSIDIAVASILTKVTSIKSMVASIKTKVTSIEIMVASILTKVTSIKIAVASVKSIIASILTNVTLIKIEDTFFPIKDNFRYCSGNIMQTMRTYANTANKQHSIP